jgi:hypothetical protein
VVVSIVFYSGTSNGGGALTLAIVAEGHLGLAEANGVFPLGDAIKLLEVGLVNTLQQKLETSPRKSNGGARPRGSSRGYALRERRAWLGKYSSMALMPILEGRAAISAVVCVRSGGGTVWERRCV